MSDTLALYAGAIMANKIIDSGKITERYTHACYCAAVSEDDAMRQLIKKSFEVYSPDNGYFDHAAVVVAIDHRAIAEVYEVK